MAWIEVHENLREHPKILMLAKVLRQPEYACVGMVVNLWLWAMTNAPDGDLSSYSAPAIMRHCGWKPSASARAFEALKACGFVDEDMKIHNWEKYAGRLLEQREAHRQRNRKKTDCAQPACIPNLTQPNLGVNDYASATTITEAEAKPMNRREKAMFRVYLTEMGYLQGERAANLFGKLLLENNFSEDQITMALEYAARKKNRGEVTQPLGYVHQLLLDWEAAGVRRKEDIIRHLSGE